MCSPNVRKFDLVGEAAYAWETQKIKKFGCRPIPVLPYLQLLVYYLQPILWETFQLKKTTVKSHVMSPDVCVRPRHNIYVRGEKRLGKQGCGWRTPRSGADRLSPYIYCGSAHYLDKKIIELTRCHNTLVDYRCHRPTEATCIITSCSSRNKTDPQSCHAELQQRRRVG